VEAAIRGMKDGTINPEDVKVAGIESAEEKAEAEVAEHMTYCCRLHHTKFAAMEFIETLITVMQNHYC
jgi:hypothetical protein